MKVPKNSPIHNKKGRNMRKKIRKNVREKQEQAENYMPLQKLENVKTINHGFSTAFFCNSSGSGSE